MTRDDRPTVPPAGKPPRPAQVPESLDDARARREAQSATRRAGEAARRLVGADRGQLEQQRRETPRGLPVPARATLTGVAPLSDPPRSQTPAEGQAAILLDELAKERAKVAQLERDARAAAEVKVASFPPPVTPAKPDPPRPKVEEAPDAAIGRSVRYLLGRAAPFLLAAAGIGGGVTAIAKPSADPAKTDAQAVELAALKRDHALVVEQLTGVLKREPQRDRYIQCIEEQLREVGEQTLPAPDRMTKAQLLRPFVEKCSRLRP